jgi:hypothetical protein
MGSRILENLGTAGMFAGYILAVVLALVALFTGVWIFLAVPVIMVLAIWAGDSERHRT